MGLISRAALKAPSRETVRRRAELEKDLLKTGERRRSCREDWDSLRDLEQGPS